LYYDTTPKNDGAQLTSYSDFSSFNMIDERYSNTPCPYQDKSYYLANDMVILDCNFGPEPSNDIIAKLDKLNDE
jgi:hypothetical protein